MDELGQGRVGKGPGRIELHEGLLHELGRGGPLEGIDDKARGEEVVAGLGQLDIVGHGRRQALCSELPRELVQLRADAP